jgi:hypothetical protein
MYLANKPCTREEKLAAVRRNQKRPHGAAVVADYGGGGSVPRHGKEPPVSTTETPLQFTSLWIESFENWAVCHDFTENKGC